MKNLLFLTIVLSLSSLAAFAQDTAKAEDKAPSPKASKAVQDTFDVLMGALQDNSYAAFISVADDDFKAALKPEMFASVVAQIAPRQKKGYDAVYMGALKKRGFDVHLWKLVFVDKEDDVLAELSLKDAKVGGFFLR